MTTKDISWCWHYWEQTLAIYGRDYISGQVKVKYVCSLCGAEKFVWH